MKRQDSKNVFVDGVYRFYQKLMSINPSDIPTPMSRRKSIYQIKVPTFMPHTPTIHPSRGAEDAVFGPPCRTARWAEVGAAGEFRFTVPKPA